MRTPPKQSQRLHRLIYEWLREGEKELGDAKAFACELGISPNCLYKRVERIRKGRASL